MKNSWVKLVALSLAVGMFGFHVPTDLRAQEPTDAIALVNETDARCRRRSLWTLGTCEWAL